MTQELIGDILNVTLTPDPTTSVKINVEDGTDKVKGASVTLNNVTRKTGDNGSTTFVNILNNTYKVVVESNDKSKSENITVTAENREFTISLSGDVQPPSAQSNNTRKKSK